jgi:hypothetical protein
MATQTYETTNPSSWKLGNTSTTPKGLKKVEIFNEFGQKPVFQLWRPTDPYLRVPYGISEPFNSGGDAPGAFGGSSGAPQGQAVSVKTMPIELKHPAHLSFTQSIDNALLSLIHSNQVRLLELQPDDEPLPISIIRRQFCGLTKFAKRPDLYPPTARVKVNVGSSELATQFSRREGQRTVPIGSDAIVRNCTVIPIIEVSGLWLSSTGGYGITAQALQVLVMTSGTTNLPSFTGLDFIDDNDCA